MCVCVLVFLQIEYQTIHWMNDVRMFLGSEDILVGPHQRRVKPGLRLRLALSLG